MVLSNFKFHSPLQQNKIQSEEQQRSVLWAKLIVQAVLRMEQVGRASFPQHLPAGKLQSRKGVWGCWASHGWPVPLLGWLLCFVLGINWAAQERWAGFYFSFFTCFCFFPLCSTWSSQLAVQPQWPCRASLHTSWEMLAVLISLDL